MIAPGTNNTDTDRRVIDGGKLYRDCAVVVLPGRGELDLLDQESVGRGVWEHLEKGIKIWEEDETQALKELAKELEKERNKAQGKGKEKQTTEEPETDKSTS